MGSNGADEVMISRGDEAEGSETTVEIKIKTLDSQIYTLRVNKRMPVPALKERIATVTGVLSDQQRLICRGKVLKDDQLLSAYHVEDGHTLHLVVRQPLHASSSSTVGLTGSERAPDHPGSEPSSGNTRNRGNPVAHSVLLGTFNVADQGDGAMPDLNRIVSAVLSSIGLGNLGPGSEGLDLRGSGLERHDRTVSSSGMSDSTQVQYDQVSPGGQFDPLHGASRLPTAASLGPVVPPVIPDSLTTLSQYLSHMRHLFDANGRGHSSSAQTGEMHGVEGQIYDTTSRSSGIQEGLPTPASLAEIMLSTRQLLIEQAGRCLSQLARQLEDEASMTDPLARRGIQSSAIQSGVLLQNLGAMLLELGRATMTLRMGRMSSEAVVNAGPAVFISTSGPNPMMVQPLPFQPGTSFGAIPMGAVYPGNVLSGGTLGSGFLPRNIDIRIRTGPSISTTNADPGNHADGQQPSEQADPASSSGTNFAQAVSGVSSGPTSRSVPVRTVVAAVPARPPSDSSGTAVGVFYPLLARMQHLSPGHHPNGSETGQQSASQSTVQQQSLGSINGSIIRESNSQTSPNNALFSEPGPSVNTTAQCQQEPLSVTNSSQQEPSHTVSIAQTTTVNNSTPSDAQQGEGSLRQIPSRFDQLLRTIFSGEQFHPNDMNIQGIPTGSVAEQTEAPRDSDPRRAINQGIFFSGLVRQMMPFISSTIGMEQAQATPATSVTNPLMPMNNDTTELPSGTLNSEGPQHAETTILDPSIPQSERENSVEVGSAHSRDEAPSSPHSKRQKRE